MTDIELKLLKSFSGSFINQQGEFVAHERANEYFAIYDCNSDLEIKCRVLGWFSRAAFKTEPFRKSKKNAEFHKFMLDGINDFLDVDFSTEDMELIYMKLGNGCNRPLCEKFVASGYDMEVLR